jgi:hypothetical protein
MKKLLFAFLILLFIPLVSLGAWVEVPPKNPNCKDGEKAACFESCMSTAVYCGPFGTFDKEGNFTKESYKDCNTTTCSWNCMCLPVSDTDRIKEK